jgi:3-phenylpropionate/cinnamic acid dioxygenase small subunit
MPKKVTVEDRLEAFDVLARYCFFCDEGDSQAWVDLWTEDGVFAGVAPEPIRGREALWQVPITSLSGGSRHKLVNLICEYGDTPDDMIVRGYNFVTSWIDGANFACNAVVRYHLVRRGDTWKIKSNRVRLQVPAGYPDGRLPPGYPYPANQPTVFPEI